ncbi:5-oxoprolinase subunit PxpB [Larsenimonas salina]|uniref:5-oxoprolinase subunit PxpB n=1 Tax=Larsenimonas salina TaxID=1295565 RepID=UPI00207456E3|nr:5-oxoprolinase subunit PxpB [Larsenimonas salina]MCM5703756.1 5-oxoprolinase subunit PxpB [Larsenimonas salina]
MTVNVEIERVGLDCLLVRLFDQIDTRHVDVIMAFCEQLRDELADAVIDLTPSYTTVLVHFNDARTDEAHVREAIKRALEAAGQRAEASGQVHELPVWFDPRVGPELEVIADKAKLSVDEVIERHVSREYRVFALGFAPGFGFMGAVDEAIAMPRLSTPRKRVAAGSVGIAGIQTAVYPSALPGGWNIIGRCPTRLFDIKREGYTLYRAGDTVRFKPIDHATFLNHGGDDTPFEGARHD